MMASRGYDMTPTMYSPDGRIYQVEYAIETVKRGSLALGMKCKEGIIIAVEEKPRTLQANDITQKIFKIDSHIGVAAAGYIPDARIQIENARMFSQGSRLTYDEYVDVEVISKHLADQCHQYTQYSGVRPYGVALIIAGIDQNGNSIYVTDPSGTYIQYKAVAIGSGADDVTDFLEKNYTDEMTLEDISTLAVAAINLKSEVTDGSVSHIKMSFMTKGKELTKVDDEKLLKYSKDASRFAK